MKTACWLMFFILAEVLPNGYSADDKWNYATTGTTAISAIRGDSSAQAALNLKDKRELLNPLKNIATSRSMDAATVNGALDRIKKIPNHCEFYRDQILSDKAGGASARNDAFKVLALLNTEESIKTVAEFLFDTSKPTTKADYDLAAPGSNSDIAMLVLSEAKIEGAPTGPVTSDNAESKLKEYQQWWLKLHPRK